jgi:hypothetical protein
MYTLGALPPSPSPLNPLEGVKLLCFSYLQSGRIFLGTPLGGRSNPLILG